MNRSALVDEVSPGLSQGKEDELVEAARHDPAAFAGLYRQYVKPVYRYLYSRIGQVDDAEDLTTQVFLEAFQGLGRYRSIGPFAAWLFTIARRRVIDHLRRRRPVSDLNDQVEASDTSGDPQVQVVQREEFQRLQAQLAGLKESDQELLRLRFAAGLGFAEIAHVLNHSEAATKMSLYRLLRRLESQMEESHE
jgi:RNA polymerase sigma-70 factor, ECF subfamily